jgi:GalNAc-alpha-(1->4)-GalNAc-alpha-(1->3)-diNAcBac-PP-undecaprenol alpha-1,4-N-acetyl-D-galactosaminyltransferase
MTARNGVILVIADMESGGAQQVASQLAAHWVAAGRRVGLLTLAAPDTDFFKVSGVVERHSIGGIGASHSLFDRLTRNVRRVLAIRRVLRAFNGDTAIGFVAPTNVLLILASCGLGLRVVISERNDPARQSFGRFWDFLRWMLYRRADLVSANSRGALQTLRAYVPEAKLIYLPNPLRSTLTGSAQGGVREPIVLNVGRLHRQKGQDLLIRAFATVAAELPGWRLCIVGEGSERTNLQTLVSSLSLGGRVELVGQAADPFVWYRRASIFAFPSRFEGTPNALLEAMSFGLPVVVSDMAPSVLELVQDGREGLVANGEDIASLSRSVATLARDEALRRKLGTAAIKQASRFAPATAFRAWDATLWPAA